MIVIAVGANLPGPGGTPLQNCEAALAALQARGVRVKKRSRWYRSPPWIPQTPGPPENRKTPGGASQPEPPKQPWYVNGVAIIETMLDAPALLAMLHQIEAQFGRVRNAGMANAARPLDLDLIDYNGQVRRQDPPILPHPRMATRAFVIKPLAEIAPDWRHPESGRRAKDLAAALPPDAVAEPMEAPAETPGSGPAGAGKTH